MPNNQYVNKVVFNGTTLMDVSGTTVAADKLLEGYTAIGPNGQPITGSLQQQSVDFTGVNVTADKLLKGYKAVAADGSIVEGTFDVDEILSEIEKVKNALIPTKYTLIAKKYDYGYNLGNRCVKVGICIKVPSSATGETRLNIRDLRTGASYYSGNKTYKWSDMSSKMSTGGYHFIKRKVPSADSTISSKTDKIDKSLYLSMLNTREWSSYNYNSENSAYVSNDYRTLAIPSFSDLSHVYLQPGDEFYSISVSSMSSSYYTVAAAIIAMIDIYTNDNLTYHYMVDKSTSNDDSNMYNMSVTNSYTPDSNNIIGIA